MEEYGKTILIEARATLDILRKQITPACMAYSRQVADGVAVKRSIGIEADVEAGLVRTITEKTALLIQSQDALSAAVAAAPVEAGQCAHYCAEHIVPAMSAARALADELELLVGQDCWPFPTYRDLLFYV